MTIVSCHNEPNGFASVEFSSSDSAFSLIALIPLLPTYDFINRRNAVLASKFIEYLEKEHSLYDDTAHVST